jgi:hypothetical protein
MPDDVTIRRNLTVNGITTMVGDLNTRHGHTINSAGRQHIFGAERLYLLNKTGVIVGKEWGGNGNLSVQGAVITGDTEQPGWTGVNMKRRDGRWTHFDWKDDQKNYIRGNTIIDGATTINGQLDTPNGHTISCAGRQHIFGAEHLFLLNKTGATVSKAWGGNGDLSVEGNLRTNVLQIGNKWRLAESDAHANNAWLRLHNVQDGLNRTGVNGYDNYKLKSGASETGGYGGHAAGQFWAASGNYFSGSDIRIKDNVKYISPNEISNLDKLKPVKYNLKSDSEKKLHYGLVAQDIEKIYPNLVMDGPDGIKSVNYQGLTPIIINKLQSMNDKIDTREVCIDGHCLTKDDIISLKKLLAK